MGRKVCLAIGVGDTVGVDGYLDGAIVAAEEIHAWAQAAGYEAVLLTDNTKPHGPTLDAITAALTALLGFGTTTDRLILFFAGHGLSGVSGTTGPIWLPSDWQARNACIGVDVLRKRLPKFGVRQISLISDACRIIAMTDEMRDLDVRGLLEQGFTNPPDPPHLDRFMAAQDGRAAFMKPGCDGAPSRCIFSGVLMQGLWGEATSRRNPHLVISTSLRDYLKREVPKRAEYYGQELHPDASSEFPEEQDVYVDLSASPLSRPSLPDWPPTMSKRLAEVAATQIDTPVPSPGTSIADVVGPMLDSVLGGILPHKLDTTILSPAGFGKSLADTAADAIGKLVAGKLRRTASGRAIPSADAIESLDPAELEALARALQDNATPVAQSDLRILEWAVAQAQAASEKQQAETEVQSREARIDGLLRETAGLGDADGNVIIAGQKVQAIWGTQDCHARRIGAIGWQLEMPPRSLSVQLLVELESGDFASGAVMQHMVTRLLINADGAAGLVLSSRWTPYAADRPEIALTESAVAQLYSGRLARDATFDRAVDLRMMKHANPVLGVISAYLYDSVGDRDSIRRMAWFYVKHHQAIPYDIAFLAELPVLGLEADQLRVRVPATEQRKANTASEAIHSWATVATPEAEGLVAGRWPWLRQGWPYVADPTEAERMVIFNAGLATQGLTSAPFTTMSADAARALIGSFGLARLA